MLAAMSSRPIISLHHAFRRSQHANFGGAAGAQDHPTIKKEESTLTIIFLPPNSVPDKSIAFLAPSGVVKWMVA